MPFNKLDKIIVSLDVVTLVSNVPFVVPKGTVGTVVETTEYINDEQLLLVRLSVDGFEGLATLFEQEVIPYHKINQLLFT